MNLKRCIRTIHELQKLGYSTDMTHHENDDSIQEYHGEDESDDEEDSDDEVIKEHPDGGTPSFTGVGVVGDGGTPSFTVGTGTVIAASDTILAKRSASKNSDVTDGTHGINRKDSVNN